jgi:ribonuclease HI
MVGALPALAATAKHSNFADMVDQSEVIIYTDGACSGNPGPGAYAAVLMANGKRIELSQGYRRTTNNRMELLAVIAALERLTRPCKVTLYSDSQYVVDSVTKRWVYGWQRNGWRKADKKPALNVDLWQRLLPQLERHEVTFKWVRGHNNNVENERCDELAVAASQGGDLLVDEGFAKAAALS